MQTVISKRRYIPKVLVFWVRCLDRVVLWIICSNVKRWTDVSKRSFLTELSSPVFNHYMLGKLGCFLDVSQGAKRWWLWVGIAVPIRTVFAKRTGYRRWCVCFEGLARHRRPCLVSSRPWVFCVSVLFLTLPSSLWYSNKDFSFIKKLFCGCRSGINR